MTFAQQSHSTFHYVFNLAALVDSSYQMAKTARDIVAQHTKGACSFPDDKVYRLVTIKTPQDKIDHIADYFDTYFEEDEIEKMSAAYIAAEEKFYQREDLSLTEYAPQLLALLKTEDHLLSLIAPCTAEEAGKLAALKGLSAYFGARVYGNDSLDADGKPDAYRAAAQAPESLALPLIAIENTQPGLAAARKTSHVTVGYLARVFGENLTNATAYTNLSCSSNVFTRDLSRTALRKAETFYNDRVASHL